MLTERGALPSEVGGAEANRSEPDALGVGAEDRAHERVGGAREICEGDDAGAGKLRLGDRAYPGQLTHGQRREERFLFAGAHEANASGFGEGASDLRERLARRDARTCRQAELVVDRLRHRTHDA
jgi:hypothetical protein